MIARRTLLASGLPLGLMALSGMPVAAAPPSGFVMHAKPLALPTVAFQASDRQKRSLDDFRGRVVLLNLWATWCAPCRAEMPTLDALQMLLGGPGFEVVALSLDRGGANDVESFYRELGLRHLAVYVDPSTDAQRSLGVFGLPTTLLIDAGGFELGRLIGPTEWDSREMVGFLRSFINQRPDREELLIEETHDVINMNKALVG